MFSQLKNGAQKYQQHSRYNKASIAVYAHELKKRELYKGTGRFKSLCTSINNAYNQKMKFRGQCEVFSKTCPITLTNTKYLCLIQKRIRP
ncbi:MAG: hypothetical protein GXY77_00520 [Fibrobacter sp.]|nr:hypothetical protein [Fibrobacter sp.]